MCFDFSSSWLILSFELNIWAQIPTYIATTYTSKKNINMALYTTTGFTNGAQKSLQVKGKKIYTIRVQYFYIRLAIQTKVQIWPLIKTNDHQNSGGSVNPISTRQGILCTPPPQIFRHSDIPAFTYDAIEKTSCTCHLPVVILPSSRAVGIRGSGGPSEFSRYIHPIPTRGKGKIIPIILLLAPPPPPRLFSDLPTALSSVC